MVLLVVGCAEQRPPPHAPFSQAPPAHAWSDASLSELRSAAIDMPLHGLSSETSAIAKLDRLTAAARYDASAATALDTAADALFQRLAQDLAHGAPDPSGADPSFANT